MADKLHEVGDLDLMDKMAHFGRNESTITTKSPGSTILNSDASVLQCSEERESE